MEIKEYVKMRKEELQKEVSSLGRTPNMAIVVVGDNPASEAYVRGKMKDCAEIGVNGDLRRLPETATEKELLDLIKELNEDPNVDGLLVQLPVPKQISEHAIHMAIDPRKDIDGFVPMTEFDCCTPKGIIDYLEEEKFPFKGKNAVVIGRSNIVGKPMARMLLARDCNVTILHSKTKEEDKAFYLKHADLIVVAVGRMNTVDSRYELNPNAWIIDVGINRGEDGKLHGDCERDLNVHFQSPVPGGVGLLTRLALLDNLLLAIKK